MRKTGLAIGAGVVLAIMTTSAQVAPAGGQKPAATAGATDLKTVLYNVADTLGMLRSPQEVDRVATMNYSATGTMTVQGKPCRLKSYNAGINYLHMGMRVDFTCDSMPERQVYVVADKFAWNETTPGVNGVPAPGTVNERQIELWTTPAGLIKAATMAGAQTKVTMEAGAIVLTFPLSAPAGAIVKATLNSKTLNAMGGNQSQKFRPYPVPAGTLIERVETRLGDVVTETTYSDYGDWNGTDYLSDVLFPRRIVRKVGGVTVADLTVTKTNTYNPYVIMPVPDNVGKAAT